MAAWIVAGFLVVAVGVAVVLWLEVGDSLFGEEEEGE